MIHDAGAVVLALAAAAGALAAIPAPPLMACAFLAVGWLMRSVVMLAVGVALLGSLFAARAWTGLRPPVTGWYEGTVSLAGDPVDVEGALRVDVRIGGKRVEAWARGPTATLLRERLSGERVWLAGRVRALPPELRVRLASRHVAGRMSVTTVGGHHPGAALARFVNGVRRPLVEGASSMRADNRSLFTGFVLGDDRGQPPEVVADFRESGLTHLLVVSGENVAFVLALASPLLLRVGLVARFVVAGAVLMAFGTLVRWEPSVVRAVAMATLALAATAMGRPASRLRLLSVAVTVVLLVDPLLVRSAGFLMSVGASAGIALLARPIADRLPGPRPLVAAMSVTIAAQVGVAPVVIPLFGGLPVASIPANLLAVPAAGPIMMWGVAAGVPAGLIGGPVATLIHLPTTVLVGWVAWVARATAGLPLGHVTATDALVLAGVLGLALVVRRRAGRTVVAVTAMCTLVAGPVGGAVRSAPCTACLVDHGVRVWRAGTDVVLVVDGPRSSLLSRARRAGIRRISLVVVARSTLPAMRSIDSLTRRVRVAVTVAPPSRSGRYLPASWRLVGRETTFRTARFRIHVAPTAKGLSASVQPLRSPP